MKKHIFLSHSSKDKPQVWKLKYDLEKEGFSVWLDEDEAIPNLSVSTTKNYF